MINTVRLLSAFLALSGSILAQDKSVGATYGTREPITCKSTKDPAKGPLSAQQAALYVRCGREGISRHSGGDLLYLYENVAFEVAKGRPYQTSDSLLTDIDPSLPVYPIRGTFDLYSCSDPRQMTPPKPGKNCGLNKNTQGTGVCYKTGFGDWKCTIGYDFDFRATVREVRGPQ
ncbi:MAG: hypothetical protein LAP38_03915 [Acidobacteriia bacterium]|nr:hypothetical protein [Terriglobia bacterium]